MKTHFLFPNKFKTLGWILFIPSFLFSLLISIMDINTDNYLKIKVFALFNDEMFHSNQYFSMIENSIVDELLLFGLIIGGILISFSKLKIEDEFTSKIRYESLVWVEGALAPTRLCCHFSLRSPRRLQGAMVHCGADLGLGSRAVPECRALRRIRSGGLARVRCLPCPCDSS